MALAKPDRVWIVALFVALGAAFLLLTVGQQRGMREREDPRASSLLSGPSGAKAYYLLLQELGVDVERSFEGSSSEPRADSVVWVVLAPLLPLRPREVDTLLQAVEGGGGLLLGAQPAGGFPEEMGFRLRWSRDSLAVRGVGRFREQGIEALSATHAYFVPGDDAPAFETLLENDSGAVAITFRRGEGRVVAFAETRFFRNRQLRAGDNAAAVVNAVTAFWDQRVLFDEAHHDFRSGGRVVRSVAAFLLGHPLGWACLQLALAGLALLYLHGRRLGAPRPATPPRRRSEIEHVEALALAYERAQAHGLVVDRLHHGLQRRLGLRRPGDPRTSGDLYAQLEYAFRDERARATLGRLRRRLETKTKMGLGDLTEFAQWIHDLEQEVRREWRSGAPRRSRARR